MSGRWFTLATLTVCVSLVLFALWQRSHDTARIRQFWGARGASLIQNAPQVLLRRANWPMHQEAPSLNDNKQLWQEISSAPGLVHLRATLVDDRYFKWPDRAAQDSERTTDSPTVRVLRFTGPTGFVEAAIDTQRGVVVDLASGRAVEIIASSRRAIAAYLDIQIANQ